MKKPVSVILLTLLFLGAIMFGFNAQPTKADAQTVFGLPLKYSVTELPQDEVLVYHYDCKYQSTEFAGGIEVMYVDVPTENLVRPGPYPYQFNLNAQLYVFLRIRHFLWSSQGRAGENHLSIFVDGKSVLEADSPYTPPESSDANWYPGGDGISLVYLGTLSSGIHYITMTAIESNYYMVNWWEILSSPIPPPPTQSSTSVVCSPNPVSVGSLVTCTATVSGSNPTGPVTWRTNSSTGNFSQSICTLSSGSCSTTYTDISPGNVIITATYSGDSNNTPSSSSATLIVGLVLVTFDQTGVGSDFTSPVVNVDATNYTASDLPISFWWVNGSTHTFAFQSPLIVDSGAKECDWASTNGLSSSQSGSITVNGSGSVIGDYVTRVHDVTVADITSNRTWIFQGFNASVSVRVLNKGDFNENATVTLYYNMTAGEIIGTQNITIPAGENETLSFVWDTEGVPYCHNYTITAAATIPLDNNPADNTLATGPITIRILGDINGDGKVDGKDIALAAWYFGTIPGEARWNPDMDINHDGKIDGKDIVLVARNFGK